MRGPADPVTSAGSAGSRKGRGMRYPETGSKTGCPSREAGGYSLLPPTPPPRAEALPGLWSPLKNMLAPTKGSTPPAHHVLLHCLSPSTLRVACDLGHRSGNPPPPALRLSPWVASPPARMTDCCSCPQACSELSVHCPLGILKAQPHPSFFSSPSPSVPQPGWSEHTSVLCKCEDPPSYPPEITTFYRI